MCRTQWKLKYKLYDLSKYKIKHCTLKAGL